MKTKRFLTLALTIIMLSSVCLMAISCGGNEEKRADISKAAKGAYNTVVDEFGRVINEYTMMTDKMTYIMPMSYRAGAPSAYSGPLTSTIVGCKVTPDYATDKTTTWSVSWAEDAYRSSQNVSDYVQLVPDAENSNLVTVNLIQYFGEDTIILTVKTNDGGFTDTCELTCFEAVKIELTAGGSPVAVQSSESIGVQYDEIGFVDYSYLDFGGSYAVELNTDSRYKSKYSYKIENVSFYSDVESAPGWSFDYFVGTSAPDFVKYESFENGCGYLCYDSTPATGFREFAFPIEELSLNSYMANGLPFNTPSYESFCKGTCSHGITNISSLGYDIFETYVPLMIKITISESKYNTSDSIYVTLKLPVSAVSLENAPDTYISE